MDKRTHDGKEEQVHIIRGEIFTVIDLRSEKKDVQTDRRKDPRLELHCDATVLGLPGFQKITDISMGGIFIETSLPRRIDVDRMIFINARLPSERFITRLKAKIVKQAQRGIGCQFVNLDVQKKEMISNCLELFKDTLPVR